MLPHDFPPWPVVYQQAQRWIRAGCFEQLVCDLRVLLHKVQRPEAQPTAAILDSRTIQSTPESGAQAGYDGYKRKKGSEVRIAVDTLGHLLALLMTPADAQDRVQVEDLTQALQEVTGESVEIAFVDQGYTGDAAAEAAARQGIQLVVVKLPEAKRGFVLLPRR